MGIGLTIIPAQRYLESWKGSLTLGVKGNSTYVFACHSRCDSRQEENVLHFLSLYELPLHMMVVTLPPYQTMGNAHNDYQISYFFNSRVAKNISAMFFWSTLNSDIQVQ